MIQFREYNITLRKIFKAFFIVLGIIAFGTLGYMKIEGWSFIDAFYMTVITVTTVGFKEVREVSQEGRIFTIILIFTGMGVIAYLLGMIAQAMAEFQIRHIIGRSKLEKKIRTIKNHYIICGFGRIGKIIVKELKLNNVPMVVIDNMPELGEILDEEEIPYIQADATNEDILIKAGIERAKGLVAVVGSDADNLFITMTARGFNPNLFILARADEEHTEKKLLRAGANRVVLPYLIGGQKMAQTITRPTVTDFLEFTVHNRKIGLELGEIMVDGKSRLNGMTLIQSNIRQEMDVIIVAIRKKGGEMQFNPSSLTRIEEGDTLVALGRRQDLERLSRILSGKE